MESRCRPHDHVLVRNSAARSGSALTAVLKRTDGSGSLGPFTVRDRENQIFDIVLAPGTYVLAESFHPDRQLRIEVVP